MPAKSKAQQQMFGIAHAIQKGTMPASKARGPATDVAKNAKKKDVKDFASTSTKGLPKKVKKEDVQRIREYVTKVVREVMYEAELKETDQEDYEDYQRRVAQKRKKRAMKTEAYNRGNAVISINGRNGHIHWRTSDGQYDADLPGNRSKEYVKRRVAQIKKQLWGYTIKIIDDGGMLKEAAGETWYLNWYDEKKKNWVEREFKSEREASKEFEKMRDQYPSISYGTDNSIYG